MEVSRSKGGELTVALVVTILSASLIAGCAQTARPVQRANPASQNCVQQGGKLAIERGPGGEIGVCLFEDNRQCEEWALLRGLCPAGGIRCAETARPVQRANPASQNCVQQGGKLVIERGPGGEIGMCLFENNRQCEEWALLRGLCPAGDIRVTGYATPEERLCAIRGGQYTNAGECRYRPRGREAAMNQDQFRSNVSRALQKSDKS